jgi:hypothetical protein
MPRVSTGPTGTITAPARSNSFAASTTAAFDLVLGIEAAAGVEHQADAHAADVDIEIGPVEIVGRQAGAVAPVRPRQRRHGECCVLDGAGHRPGAAADIIGIDGDAALARLEAEDAGPTGGQAHGAADIGADMQGAVAGRSGGGRTGAGAAGVLGDVPGVAAQMMEARQARGQHAVIGACGLGEHDGAVLAHPCCDRGVLQRGLELDRGLVPSGTGWPLVAISSFSVTGMPSSTPMRLALHPALAGGGGPALLALSGS